MPHPTFTPARSLPADATRFAPPFAAQHLTAYQVALDVLGRLVAVTETWPRGWADLADQGKRAATSAFFNLAEGAGQPAGGRAKARHYEVALGSAGEVAAVLDAAWVLRLADGDKLDALGRDGRRLGALLGGLVRRARR